MWLEDERGGRSGPAGAITAAAFLSARTSAVRLAARAGIGPHPVLIAEQSAVADNACGGRLTLVLDAHAAGRAELEETAEIVLACVAPRPFTHAGPRWTIPGAVDGNEGERRLSVTPKPAQLELPVWLIGDGAPEAGRNLGLTHVADVGMNAAQAEGAWSGTEQALGRVAGRMRRPALRELRCGPAGDFNDEALATALIGESEQWGLDVAILRLPDDLAPVARRRALARLTSLVRPHLAIDRIPARVHEYWRRELAPRFSE